MCNNESVPSTDRAVQHYKEKIDHQGHEWLYLFLVLKGFDLCLEKILELRKRVLGHFVIWKYLEVLGHENRKMTLKTNTY